MDSVDIGDSQGNEDSVNSVNILGHMESYHNLNDMEIVINVDSITILTVGIIYML